MRASVIVVGLILTSVVGEASAVPTARDIEAPIQPGARYCVVVGGSQSRNSFVTDEVDEAYEHGTLNFVFRDRRDAWYIGMPAHGVRVGFRVFAFDPDELPVGTVVFDSDSVDFGEPLHCVVEPTAPASGTGECVPVPDRAGLDFALVRIDRHRVRDVNPTVRGIGGPTGVATAHEVARGDVVAMYGQGPGDETRARRDGPLTTYDGTSFTSADLMSREAPGDSGSPYIHVETGLAVGINGNCVCSGSPGYPTVEHVLRVLEATGSFAGIRLVTTPGGDEAHPVT